MTGEFIELAHRLVRYFTSVAAENPSYRSDLVIAQLWLMAIQVDGKLDRVAFADLARANCSDTTGGVELVMAIEKWSGVR